MPCGQPTERRAVIDGREIRYELHLSPRRRKSIALIVNERQQLRVLAPKRTSLKDIDAFLHRRAQWIQERLAAPTLPRLRDQLRPGGTLPLLGADIPVHAGPVHTDGEPFRFDGQRFFVDNNQVNHVEAAERWFREYARRDFSERVDSWGERIGVTPTRIQIRDQKTRWGSASAKGTLSFNWRLVFARPEIVDYVVVHEICHLIRLDHSPAYWALVESHLHDYRQRRQTLKKIGDSLVW